MERYQSSGFHWLLQRITAIYLAFGLFVHFLYIHYLSGREMDFEMTAERLGSSTWILFDITLLAAATYHGLNGLRNIAWDYIVHPRARTYIAWGLFSLGIIAFVIGVFILDPLSGMT